MSQEEAEKSSAAKDAVQKSQARVDELHATQLAENSASQFASVSLKAKLATAEQAKVRLSCIVESCGQVLDPKSCPSVFRHLMEGRHQLEIRCLL